MLKRILQSPLFTVLALVGLIFFLSLIVKLYPSLVTVQKEVGNLNDKIAEVEGERSELEKLEEYFRSSAYLERQVKAKLNYKKPDENVVFVYRNEYNQEPAETASKDKEKPRLPSNFEKWFQYLLGE
ncbi:MAG: septum formation initiator family protein [Candidatus Paceibacterota bacterium]